MSSNPTVYVYNANTLGVTVQVNNGQSYTIAGTTASGSYAPVLGNGGTTWTTSGGSPNVLGIGSNSVAITPSNSNKPTIFPVVVPSGPGQLISLQLYIFFATEVTATWILLNNGQVIGQNSVSLSSGSGSSSSSAAKKR